MTDESVLNRNETIELLKTFSEEQKSNYMLQRMIEDYLKKLNLPSMAKVFEKTGEKEEAGVLTKTHVRLLQCMVKDYYLAIGSNFDESVKSRGITIVDGTLSDLEQECVDKLLTDYCKAVNIALSSII